MSNANVLNQLQSSLVNSTTAVVRYQGGSWCDDQNGVHLDIETLVNPRLAIVGDNGSVELAGVSWVELVSGFGSQSEIWLETGGGLVRFVRSE